MITNYKNSAVEATNDNSSSYSILNVDIPNTQHDDEQAINLRVQDAYQNLEDDESTNEMDEIELSSDSESDSKESTYQEDDDAENPSISTAIDSHDFTFNIENVYELNTIQDEVNPANELDIISIINDPINLNDSSSISNLDVPITQLANEERTSLTSDSTSVNETLTTNGVQCFQEHGSYDRAVHVMFTQMSAHKGIKLFGERAIAAMMKELKQLNNGVIPGNPVIQPIPFEELTLRNKKEALEAVNIIAQKNQKRSKTGHVLMAQGSESI